MDEAIQDEAIQDEAIQDAMLIARFLYGMTLRQLEGSFGKKQNGNWALVRLKRFNLRKEDKGRLFAFSQKEREQIAKKIIAANSRRNVEAVLDQAFPKKLERHRGIVLIANDVEEFCRCMSGMGLFRDLIKDYYRKRRKEEICWKAGCEKKGTQTAHLLESRPEIIRRAAMECATRLDNGKMEFPICKIALLYMNMHGLTNSVGFMCPEHHREQEKTMKDGIKGARKYIKNHVNPQKSRKTTK